MFLETDKAEDVGFYEKFGFTLIGETEVLELHSWSMARPSIQNGRGKFANYKLRHFVTAQVQPTRQDLEKSGLANDCANSSPGSFGRRLWRFGREYRLTRFVLAYTLPSPK